MDAVEFLKNMPLGKNFTEQELVLLSSLLKEHSFEKGEELIKEGEVGDLLFMVKEGEVEIVKRESKTTQFHRIALLSSGSCVGEMALFTPLPRSASVRATQLTRCYGLSIKELTKLAEQRLEYAGLQTKLSKYFATLIDNRLRQTNEKMAAALQLEVENARAKVQISYFLIGLSIAFYFYALILKGLAILIKEASLINVFTNLLIVLLAAGAILAMTKSRYSWSFYGVTFKNWQKHALQAIGWSLPVMALSTLIKWLLVQQIPQFAGEPLIDLRGPQNHSVFFNMGEVLLYVLLVPLQELIVRGGLQSSFQNLFAGPRKGLYANLIANLYFSIFHLHQSYIFALSVFILGLFWGWLYTRQNSLVGPVVSHSLLGIWTLAVLNAKALFIF